MTRVRVRRQPNARLKPGARRANVVHEIHLKQFDLDPRRELEQRQIVFMAHDRSGYSLCITGLHHRPFLIGFDAAKLSGPRMLIDR